MQKILLILLFSGGLLQLQSQNRISSLLNSPVLRTASYSYYAIEANTGRIVQQSPQKSLVPASVMKLVTTAAAMEILGPAFRFKTQMGFTGNIDPSSGILTGDLVIRGGCDPAFYSRYFSDYYKGTFENWAEKIKKAGIKKIRGDLRIDLSALDTSSIPGGWIWEDIGNYYGTGVSALNYFDNLYEIHFRSSAVEGDSAKIIYTDPPVERLNLTSKVVTSAINADLSCVYAAPHSYCQEILGTVPVNRSDFLVKAAAPDPARIAASVFRKILLSNDIQIEGRIAKTDQSGAFTLLAEKVSPELREMIVPLNQKSINLFSEQYLREIGRTKKQNPSLQPSLQALKEFWESKQINLEGYYPDDGSGLSRSNNICPRTLVEILYYMYNSSDRAFFFNSLPLAGVSGTLENLFKRTPLENNLRAKTGSMKRVRSMAGVFTNRKGNKIIFALIINNFEGKGINQVFEDFLMDLYSNS